MICICISYINGWLIFSQILSYSFFLFLFIAWNSPTLLQTLYSVYQIHKKTRFYSVIKPKSNNNNLFSRFIFFCTTHRTQLFRLTFEYHLLCIVYRRTCDGCTHFYLWNTLNVYVCVCFSLLIFGNEWLMRWPYEGLHCVRLTHLSVPFACSVSNTTHHVYE